MLILLEAILFFRNRLVVNNTSEYVIAFLLFLFKSYLMMIEKEGINSY